ncbi:hypothetical protein K6025_02375 [Ehrlichia sp. JZT12]
MLPEDNEDHVITKQTLQEDISILIQELLLFSIPDPANVIPLCIIVILDTQPDFSSFKKKVYKVLQKYKEWIIQERQKNSQNMTDAVVLPSLFDNRVSETIWNNIKEMHTLYHYNRITISTNGTVMESRNKASFHGTNSIHGFKTKVITIQNNLKYTVQYIILKEFLKQHKKITTGPISEYQEKILNKTNSIRHTIIRNLLDIIHYYTQHKAFFSYGEYLKHLYNIYTSYVIYSKINPLLGTKGGINTKLITINNISNIIAPILENGCDIRIDTNIPPYFSIFLETSNITISGIVHGTVFNKYGNITIINAKEECTGNIMSIFGTTSINGKIIDTEFQYELFIPKDLCKEIKCKSTMFKKTNESLIDKKITSFSEEDIINPEAPTNINAIRIELQHPCIRYRAVIASIGWKSITTLTTSPTTEEDNITTNSASINLISDIIHNLNHLNIIDNISEDKQLMPRFFTNGISQFPNYVYVEDEKLIIDNLTNRLGNHLTYITSNGTVFKHLKPKIKEIVIYYKVKEFISLILHDTDVTIYGDFCGTLHTNAGNITIIGKLNSNSKISSNSGFIKIHAPSLDPQEVVVSKSHIKSYSPEVKIDITGQVSSDSRIEHDYSHNKVTIHRQLPPKEVPTPPSSFLVKLSSVFSKTSSKSK